MNKDFALGPFGQFFFFLVICLCNICFLILWILKFLDIFRGLIKERYSKIYILIFLCGRKDKMKFETAKRAKDQKNEEIIESIEDISLFLAKMKSIYSKKRYYEDHKRFLKLLYYI